MHLACGFYNSERGLRTFLIPERAVEIPVPDLTIYCIPVTYTPSDIDFIHFSTKTHCLFQGGTGAFLQNVP